MTDSMPAPDPVSRPSVPGSSPAETSASDAGGTVSPRLGALARAVTETEVHVAVSGWDQPVRVFALVRTAAALEADPDVITKIGRASCRERV